MRNKHKYHTIYNWKSYGIKFYDEADEDYIYDYYINTTNCENCNKVFKNTKDRQLDHCHLQYTIRGIICNTCNCRVIEKCAKLKQRTDPSCTSILWEFSVKRDGKIVVDKKSTNKEYLEEWRLNWIDNNLSYFTYF